MDMDMETPQSPTVRANTPRSSRRVQKACQRCKRRKIKCSGEHPCRHCKTARHECLFDEGGRRVLVLQSELRNLKEKVTALESRSPDSRIGRRPNEDVDSLVGGLAPTSPPVTHGEGHASQLSPANSLTQRDVQNHIDQLCEAQAEDVLPNTSPSTSRARPCVPACAAWSQPPDETSGDGIPNLLTSAPSRFAIDPLGSQRYLGHSSTWSFSWHVRTLVKSHVDDFQLHDEIAGIEGAAYGMSTVLENGTNQHESLGLLPGLPPIEYVEYLLNSIEFHVGSVLHLFDKASFLNTLKHQSSDAGGLRNESTVYQRLWLVQASLIIALGKLLIGQQATEYGPPGAESFIEAVRSLPSIYVLCKQPILGVEVLCLLALYLQCADMRNAAYVYIGQATSIALSQGLNRVTKPGAAAPQIEEHRLKLWWTVYILERRLSTLMGVPPLLNDDEDINVPLPDQIECLSDKPVKTVLTLHVKLAQIMGKAVKRVYRLNGDSKLLFLDGIQAVLSDLSGLIEELNTKTPLWSNGAVGIVSRNSATLHLTYHQCIILAIRPLVFYMAQKKLEMSRTSEMSKEISEPIRALLQTCVESAKAALGILSALHEQSLIALFLPFDSESTFSSAFTIILASIVDATFIPTLKYFDAAKYILHNMSQRGNMQAINYEAECGELYDMASILRGHRTTSPNTNSHYASGMDNLDLPPVRSLIGTDSMHSALQSLDDGCLNAANLDDLDAQWFWEPDSILM